VAARLYSTEKEPCEQRLCDGRDLMSLFFPVESGGKTRIRWEKAPEIKGGVLDNRDLISFFFFS